jgi:hypothetical protein
MRRPPGLVKLLMHACRCFQVPKFVQTITSWRVASCFRPRSRSEWLHASHRRAVADGFMLRSMEPSIATSWHRRRTINGDFMV